MASVSTVALIARKTGLPRSLFSAYWRDVHGTLATRIPGFASYVQYHLEDPLEGLCLPDTVCDVAEAQRFDGLAEVDFADAADREGLASSDVATMIHEDEQNAFRATLLYNLEHGASQLLGNPQTSIPGGSSTVLILSGHSESAPLDQAFAAKFAAALTRHPGIFNMRWHTLASGNPHDWDTPNVGHGSDDTRGFDAIARISARSTAALVAALALAWAENESIAGSVEMLQVYPVSARCAMIENSAPTLLGLRGHDVMQTIEAVGARNQCQAKLLKRLYGVAPAGN